MILLWCFWVLFEASKERQFFRFLLFYCVTVNWRCNSTEVPHLTSVKCGKSESSSEEPLFVTTLRLYCLEFGRQSQGLQPHYLYPNHSKGMLKNRNGMKETRNTDVLCRNLVELAQQKWLHRSAKSKFWQSAQACSPTRLSWSTTNHILNPSLLSP